ncbi:MAG: hypothetical protein Q8Q00_08440 [Dehalococcoidia bacterium]|nr:hypothetical protein [Dehalococcoidia bacterium]
MTRLDDEVVRNLDFHGRFELAAALKKTAAKRRKKAMEVLAEVVILDPDTDKRRRLTERFETLRAAADEMERQAEELQPRMDSIVRVVDASELRDSAGEVASAGNDAPELLIVLNAAKPEPIAGEGVEEEAS